ncbi:MAG TPA: hypothetical protein VK805_17920 [Candidatus Baltobacteraceae bacterium]|nr:hypothetical protein [Candidatus Baltobacteraceae bacterium]
MTKGFTLCEEGGRKFLLLQGPWTDDIGSFMRPRKIDGLRLSAYAGWNEQSIDFLKSLPFLARLDLWTAKIRDLSPLYTLPKLRALSLNGVSKKIDFTKIQGLEDLHLSQWREARFNSIFECKMIKNLAVTGYSGVDLKPFTRIATLTNLAMSFSKLLSLEGAAALPALVRLSLASTNQIDTLNGIQTCNKLLLLWVESARKLRNLGAISSIRSLRTLNLSDCPSLESIKPMARLPELEAVWFYGSTNIHDGDLSPLTTLPKLKYAKFVDREHYSHANVIFPKSLPIFQ